MLNKHHVASVVFAALLGFSGIATAQDQSDTAGYIGMRYADLDTEIDLNIGSGDLATPALMLNVGSQINPHFAVEGRLGFGIDDDDGLELDSYYGIFARVGAPLSEKFAPYLLIGYGKAELEADTVSADDNDFAYGIGANINVKENFAISIEYVNYYDESSSAVDVFGNVISGNISIQGFAVGFQHRF